MTTTLLRAFASTMLLSAVAIAQPADDFPPVRPGATHIPERGARIPFTLSVARPVPVVQAMVNGRGPFRFLLDTGASVTVFDRAFVEGLGLRFEGETEIGDPSGRNPILARTLTIDAITVADARFDRVPVVAFDRSPIPTGGEDIKGVLGLPLFADALLTVDYPNGEVRVTPGDLPEPDGRSVLPYDASGPLPLVDVRVGDEVVHAHIDSGSPLGLKLPGRYEQTTPLKSEIVVEGRGRSVNNEFEIRAASLDGSMWIGAHEFSEPRLRFADVFPQPVFGYETLKHFAITFDQRRHRVRFSRAETGPIAPEPPRAPRGVLGFTASPEPGGIRVRETMPDSAAARAGLLANDLITALNGRAIAEIPQSELREVLAQRPLRLTVRREGVQTEIVIDADPEK